MVLHTCIKCLKVFDKKSNFIMHTEHRKRPCKNTHELVAPNLHLGQKMAPTLVILAPEMTKKLNIENRLEEALMINTKLFEKVKRMESQIRDMLCNN